MAAGEPERDTKGELGVVKPTCECLAAAVSEARSVGSHLVGSAAASS